MASISFTSVPSVTSNAPIFKAEPDMKFVPATGKDGYVTLNATSGLFNTLPKGALPARLDDYDNKSTRILVLGDEEDISSRVGSTIPVYTLPMGIRYPDNSSGAAFNFKDAVVEYRSNIGKYSTKPSIIAGKSTAYGISYASVGIPLDRYIWIKKSLADIYEIHLTNKEKAGPKIHNGYAWFTVNIAKETVPTAYITKGGKTEVVQLVSLLTTVGKSFLGTVTVTAALKRLDEDGVMVRALSFSLKSIQVKGDTELRSPPLNSTLEYIVDKNIEVSNSIWDLVQSSKTANVIGQSPANKSITSGGVTVPTKAK